MNRCADLLFPSKRPNCPTNRESRGRDAVINGCCNSIESDNSKDASGAEQIGELLKSQAERQMMQRRDRTDEIETTRLKLVG